MKTLVAATAVAAVAVAFSGSASSMDIYKDYVPSKEVWNVTLINVKPNRFEDYLEGLKQTWWQSCEIGKKQGQILDCGIYSSTTPANRDYNLILVIKTPSAAMSDPDEQRYNQFMAEWRKQLAEDVQDKIVEGYDEMRTFHSEQDFRQITFK